MKIRLIYRPEGGSDARLSRFRRVLLAAQNTRRYRPALERAGLSTARAIARLSSIEEALYQLPRTEWAEFQESPDEFRNPAAPPARPASPRCRAHPEMRAAVLGPGLGKLDEARQLRPEAIGAPVRTLLQLAEVTRLGVRLPSETRALVAFTGLEHGALPQETRDTLWRAFEVPVFEQWLGAGGGLLAWECDAHDGLHTVEENAIVERGEGSELVVTSLTEQNYPALRMVTSFTAEIEPGTCGCGLAGPRLLGLSTHVETAKYQYCGA